MYLYVYVKKKKRSIDIIFPRHNRLHQALTQSYTLRQIVLWTCGDPYLTSRRRILAPSTSQIWGHTHAGTHKEYIKVTLDCIPHFFLFAVAAPTRTREFDSCDKTQEHKQSRKRAREKETGVHVAAAPQTSGGFADVTRLDCFTLARLLCLQRGVLLSLGKFSHALAERFGCEENPEFWSQICLRG